MKKNIIILNDTLLIPHYGCKFVSLELTNLLIKNNFKIVARGFTGEKYQNVIDKIKKHEFDAVIVNGEGTLHHKNNYSQTIFKIINYIKNNYSKKVFIINSVIQDLPRKSLLSLKNCDKIFVRESISQKYLRNYKIKSKVVPDLMFNKNFKNISKRRSNRIVLTDSVFDETTNKIIKIIKQNKKYLFCPLIKKPDNFLNKNNKRLFRYYLSRIKYITLYFLFNINVNKTNYYINNDKKFLEILKNSSLNICGRFHAVVLSLIMLRPFVVLESNTHKVQGLLKDININRRLKKINQIINLDINNLKLKQKEIKQIIKYKKKAKIKIKLMFKEINKSI